MPHQALYLKWRPQLFEDVVGQEHIIRTLRNSLKSGRIRHAYLFSGPRGTGKTTSARLLAKAVNCTYEDPEMRPCNECPHCVAVNEGRFLDLLEIDAASHTGVDDVRDLRDKIAFAPNEGRYKVYIIDEVHRFSGNAFDALLKTLEEPPPHAIFVLATTEIDKVPATIKSRCLPFEFRRLSLQEVADRLQRITNDEGIKIDRASLELIAREGTGSARDSISLLDQVVADPAEEITIELTERILGTASMRAVRDLVAALIEKNTSLGVHVINHAIDNGSDPRQFGQQIVEHLRAVLLTQTASAELLQVSQEERALYAQQATQISRSELLRALRAFNETVSTAQLGWQPQLGLELAYLESLEVPAQQPLYAAPVAGIPAPATPVEVTPMMAGATPVIPLQVVSAKWVEAQRLIHQHAGTATDPAVMNLPNLMQHAHIRSVDGNVVIVGVAEQLLLEKLKDPTRMKWIERAISRVTNKTLYVRFVLDDGAPSDTRYMSPSPDIQTDDPLILDQLEAGGELVSFEEEHDE